MPNRNVGNDQSNQSYGGIDIRNISVPLLTNISVITFFCWLIIGAFDAKDNLTDDFRKELKETTQKFDSDFKMIKDQNERLLENFWTKKDQLIWCYEIQKKNQGFVCPDYNFLKQQGLLGTCEQQNHSGFYTTPKENVGNK